MNKLDGLAMPLIYCVHSNMGSQLMMPIQFRQINEHNMLCIYLNLVKSIICVVDYSAIEYHLYVQTLISLCKDHSG